MYLVSRTARFVRGALLSYGPRTLKQFVWNKEFAEGTWSFIDNTAGDCVYPILEKHARSGNILDLGCGPGNTANELNSDSYSSYLGVDISEEAVAKAIRRTSANGRADKNRFATSDFLSYEPGGLFDVILLRESMYHVPIHKIKPLLDKYSHNLSSDGVFIIRMYVAQKDGQPARRPTKMINVIEGTCNVVEKHRFDSGAMVLVCRPKSRAI